MGILNYINEKKGQFKEKKDEYLNQRAIKAEKEAARMNNERLKTETRLESQRAYAKEKALLQAAKKEEFQSSAPGQFLQGVGKASSAIKEKLSQNKKSTGGFGFGETKGYLPEVKNTNTFGGSFGEQKNAPTLKKKKQETNPWRQ